MKRLGLLLAMVIAIVFTVSCVTKEVPVTETYYETEYRSEEYTDIENTMTTITGEDELKPKVYWGTSAMTISFKTTDTHGVDRLWYFGYELPKYKTAKISVYTFIKPEKVAAFDISNQDSLELLPTSDYWLLGQWPEEWKPPPDSCPSRALPLYVAFLNSTLPKTQINQVNCTGNVCEFNVSGITKLALFVEVNNYVVNPVNAAKLTWSDNVVEKKTVLKQRPVPYQVEKQRTVTQTKRAPFWEVILSK